MIFLEYPKCTTCKKAKKWLDDHGVAYEDRNIKEQNPTAEELKAWHDQSGQPLRKFFNTSGMLYREYELKDKLPNMTEEEMLNLLASDGMLVKRPLLIADGNVLIGFKEKQWEETPRSSRMPSTRSIPSSSSTWGIWRKLRWTRVTLENWVPKRSGAASSAA